ncbi:hypothetical protein L873DRAFT_1846130 [Choiromyces venosus 120613-1]|uniref:Zn(2)-C6 fungal-type domain-containing protein n=1 Tax=Choiromyces venosus 120613-1 TaxID=1336337 RepID=A0A3N4JA31_9PEZI|nr:hypothetical protein L873DRAFT_1846130 [Choiromyces venosus 120613-1]
MNYTENPLRFPSGPPPLSPSRSSPASAFQGFFNFASSFPSATPFGETPASSSSAFPSPPRSQEQQQQQQALLTSQPRQIHRNRISYSCHACRRRKVKCDRQHPICGNCTRTSDACVYDDHSNKKGTKSSVQQPQSITNPPRTKRQRATEDSEDGETSESYSALGITTNNNGPESTSLGQGKQEDLETRMNRLAEIVDRWYKDAYGQGAIPPVARQQAVGSAVGVSGSDTRSPFRGTSGHVPTFENLFPQEQSILDNIRRYTRSTNDASASPGRSISDSSVSSAHSPRSQNTVTTPGSSANGHSQQACSHENPNGAIHPPEKMSNGQLTMKLLGEEIEAARAKGISDDIDDLGLGHLSIQGRGRSRYVGSSFWASISHEITELNEVLRANEPPCAGRPPGPPPEEMIKLFQKPRNSTASNTASKSTTSSTIEPSQPSSIASAPNFCGLSQLDKSSLLPFEARESRGNPCEIIPLILRDLPDKSVCDIMYKAFLNGVHPIMPLIHVPTFQKEYNAFWAWFPDNIRSTPDPALTENHGLLPLLFSVLYAGSMSLPAKVIEKILPGQTKMEVTKSLYSGSMHALSASSFPRTPTVSSLIAFLIVQTCLIREEEPLTSCSFIGMAMRVAQSMGLHRDGSLFGLNEIECEVRRRVWWHIIYLDIQGAIATGLPPLGGSGEEFFDTKMVSELKDEYIGLSPEERKKATEAAAAAAAAAATRPQTSGTHMAHTCKAFLNEHPNSPAMILAAGRYDTTIVLRKIITRLFSTKPPQKADLLEMGKTIFELKLRLEDRIARIPARGVPEMGVTPPHDPEFHELIGHNESFSDTEKAIVFNGWARIMLSMFADRAFGVLYQPFLKSSKSRLWDHARHCALHFCASFLRKFVHVSKNPLFQPYQWFCPGTYQPLHATMILLIDLHERPLSVEAPQSRIFVDEIFALFGEDGNSLLDAAEGNRPLLEGGSLAWKMLARLRKKAYERAGIRIDKPAEKKEEEGMATPTAPVKAEGIVECNKPPNFDSFAIPAVEDVGGKLPEPDMLSPPLDIPTGGFEEMLFITDNVATGTGQYKDTTEAAMKIWEGMAAAGIAVNDGAPMDPGMPTPPPTELPMGVPTGNVPGVGADDVMDFDWEEWDAVFGRFTAVEGMVSGDIPLQ